MTVPQVLRYPYDLLTDTTDYLQIDLVAKSYAGTTKEVSITRRKTDERGNPVTTTDNVNFTKLKRDGGFARNNAERTKKRIIGSNQKLSETFVTTNTGIIILPIPSNISDSNSVSYSEDKLDAITAAAGGLAYNAMKSDFGPNFATDFGNRVKAGILNSGLGGSEVADIYIKNLATQAAGIAGIGNMSLDQLLARSEGKILNPNMELLFNGPTIRSFKFSFKFTPRSKKEADQVKLIIGSLKKHMVPQNAGTGTFLGTPNFFELRYRQGKGDHSFLNKFKQCVLENMSVNYTGENTYAVYDDGTPISMIMDLTFKELEPIYSTDYDKLTPKDGVGY